MDPKQQLNQLDPKLKEAYERVMGTPVAGSAPASPTPPSPTQPVANTTAAATPTQPMPGNPFGNAQHPLQMPQPPLAPQQPATSQPANPAPASAHPSPVANPFGTPAANTPAPAQTDSHPSTGAASKPSTSHGFVAGKKGFRMSPLLLIVGGVVFLLVYTIFWLKFFNIPLPFSVPFLSQ